MSVCAPASRWGSACLRRTMRLLKNGGPRAGDSDSVGSPIWRRKRAMLAAIEQAQALLRERRPEDVPRRGLPRVLLSERFTAGGVARARRRRSVGAKRHGLWPTARTSCTDPTQPAARSRGAGSARAPREQRRSKPPTRPRGVLAAASSNVLPPRGRNATPSGGPGKTPGAARRVAPDPVA
jgi:hypothetical protein